MIKLSVTYVKPRATIVYVKAAIASSSVEQKFLVQFQDINTVISYIKATAVDVALNPSSLNQWFRDETFSVTDANPTITYNKNFAHTITFSESLSSAVTFVRSASESFSVAESSSYSFVTAKADSFSTSDSPTWSFNGNYTESVTVTEAATVLFEKPAADAFAITDAAPSFEIALTQGALADSFTISESPTLSINLSQFAESFSVADSLTAGLLVPIDASDAFSLSDSISTQLIFGVSSQFNRPVFNAAQFNQ